MSEGLKPVAYLYERRDGVRAVALRPRGGTPALRDWTETPLYTRTAMQQALPDDVREVAERLKTLPCASVDLIAGVRGVARCEHEITADSGRQTFCLGCGEVIAAPERRYLRPHDVPAPGWHCVGDMPPFGEPYYAAWRGNNGSWIVIRVAGGAALPPQATHWHADDLGLPVA